MVYNSKTQNATWGYPVNTAYVTLTSQIATPSNNTIRVALAGDPSCFTDQTLQWAKTNGVTEIHVVPYSLDPNQNTINLIHKYGMTGIYDVEGPLWALRGYSSAAFSDTEMSQLKGIKNAGWDGFASEGLFGGQVQQINSIGLPYISYGSEIGTILYAGQPNIYQHPLGSHAADYAEIYDVNLKAAYFNEIKFSAALNNRLGNGLTIGLWVSPGVLGGQNPALINKQITGWVTELWQSYHIKVGTVLFWTGMGQCPFNWVQSGGAMYNTFQDVKSYQYT